MSIKSPKNGTTAPLNETDREDLRYLEMSGNPIDQKFAKAAREGKLPEKGRSEIIRAIKDAPEKRKDVFNDFKESLVNNIYQEHSTLPLVIARALKAPTDSDEYKYAAKLLRQGEKLSAWEENNHKENLAEMHEARVGKSTREQTGANAMLVEGQAATGTALKAISETPKPSEFDSWERGRFPAEYAERLHAFNKRFMALVEESKQTHDESRQEEIIKEIDRLTAEYTPELEAEKAHIETMRGQIIKVQRFAKDLGINPGEIMKIWRLDDKTSRGIKINSRTGKAEKLMGEITIDRIWFQQSGVLMVDYTDSDGVHCTAEHEQNFRNMVLAMDGHNEVAPEDFDKEIGNHTGYKSIRECIDGQMTLMYYLPSSQNEEGIVDHELIKFQIQDYDGETITLNTPVLGLKKETLAQTTPDNQYHDRIQIKFSRGEFANFLKRNNVERILSDYERNSVYAKANQDANDHAAAHFKATDIEGLSKIGVISDKSFTPPAIGKSKKVILYAQNGPQEVLVKAYKAADGTTVFAFIPPRTRDDRETADIGQDILSLADAKRKMEAARKQAEMYNADLPLALSDGEMMRLAAEGNITDRAAAPHIKRAALRDLSKELQAAQQREESSDSEEPKGPEASEAPEAPKDTSPASVEASKYPALPYEDVFKYGGMSKDERGMLSQMWSETRFFSVNDIWALGKAAYEYYIRRFERKQKGKYSSVAKDIPFFAPEFQRINQSAETEEMNQFKETFEQKGIWEIRDRLCSTKNQDEMKAAFIVLQGKGQMRWDDIAMWKNLNNFVSSEYAIPIPANGDPRTQISKDDERTGLDLLKGAIDSLWGEGGYNEWYATNKSAYESGTKKYYEEGKQLEGVNGGHERRLSILLQAHKEGQYIDPQEYEGLILHAIDFGKASMQAKIYYMIEGVAVENPNGRTILDVDRMAHINSEMLAKFPILEYMCASVPRSDGKGSYRFTKDDYKAWAEIFDEGNTSDPSRNKPGPVVDKFMWKHIIPSDQTQNRINKAIRNGENLDHDDMFAYLPPASEGVISDASMSIAGAGKKFFTVEGYANAFPGFSQYMRTLAENGNKNKLLEAVRSYVRYESIMLNRWEKGNKSYQRLDDSTLRGSTIVSETSPEAYIAQTNRAVDDIVAYYSKFDSTGELARLGKLIHTDVGRLSDDANKKLNGDVQDALERFGRVLEAAIKASPDKGDAMVGIVRSANFEGMAYKSSAEKDARKAAKSPTSPSL